MEPRSTRRTQQDAEAMNRLLTRRSVTREREGREEKNYRNMFPATQRVRESSQRLSEQGLGYEAYARKDPREGLWKAYPRPVYSTLKFASDLPVVVAQAMSRSAASMRRQTDLADQYKKETGKDIPGLTNMSTTDEFGRIRVKTEQEIEEERQAWRDYQLQQTGRITPNTFWEKFFLGETPVGTPYQNSYDFGRSIAESFGFQGVEADAFGKTWTESKAGQGLQWLDTFDIIPVGLGIKAGTEEVSKKGVKIMFTELAERQKGRFTKLADPETVVRTLVKEQKVDQGVAEAFASQIAKSADETRTARLLEMAYQTSYEVSRVGRQIPDVVRSVIKASDDVGIDNALRRYAKTVTANVSDDLITTTRQAITEAKVANNFDGVTKAVANLQKTLQPEQQSNVIRALIARANNLKLEQVVERSVDDLLDALDKPVVKVPLKKKALTQSQRDERLFRQLQEVDAPGVKNKLNTFDELLNEREALDESLRNSPGQSLMPYTSNKASATAGGRKGLPEITGDGKSKFSKEGDQIIDELGLNIDEANKAVEDYQIGRERLKELDERIRQARKDLRDELALQKISERQLVTETASKKPVKLDTEARQQAVEVEEGWKAAGYKEAPNLSPGVLNPENAKGYRLFKDGWEKWIAKRLTEYDDAHHALRKFMQLNKQKFNMRGVKDLYETTVNFYGRRSANYEDVDRWVVSMTAAIEATAKRLNIDPVDLHKTISDYQYARHAVDYNAKLGDGAAGISTEMATQMRKNIEAMPYFDEIRQADDAIMDFHKQTLDLLYDYGMLTDESYRALRLTYGNHVPLQRVMDEDDLVETIISSPFKVSKTGIYKAVGSEREVKDVFDNIVRTRLQTIERTEKNLVLRNLDSFAKENADLVTDKGDELFQFLNQKQYQSLISKRPGKAQNVATFFVDGKKQHIYINDPDLAGAILANTRKNAALSSSILRASRTVTRMLSSMFTQLNPNFGMPNNIRDLQEAAVYLSSIGEGQIAKRVGGKTVKLEGHRSILDWIRKKDTEGARLYEEMRLAGGTSSGGGGLSQLSIDEMYDRTHEIQKLYHSKPKKAGKQAIELVSNWNRLFEDATRLDVYKAARESGASKERAAFLAKKATIDFDQMGTQMPAINAMYMFAKVGAVGSVKALRAMRNPKTLAKTVGVVTGGVASVNAMNDAFYPEWRSLVTDYERESSLPIVIPTLDGKPLILRIPIAYALRPIKVAADRGYDLASGHERDTSKFMWHTLTTTLSSFNPLGGHDVYSAAVPTALDVPIDIARNKSWTGNSIVSPFETTKSPHLQYYPSLKDTATGRFLVRMTDNLHHATGISISPAHLMYAFDQYSGGPGTVADQLTTMAKDISSGEMPDLKNIPIVSSFLRKRDPKEYFSTAEVYKFSKVISRNRADQNHYVTEAAEDIYQQLNTMSDSEKQIMIRHLLNDQPEVYKKLKQVAEDAKRGLTAEDRNIKSHTIKNGDRARVVYFKIYGHDEAKQKEVLLDLVEKGVVTETVYKQVQYFLKEGKQPEELIREPERELIYGDDTAVEPKFEGVNEFEIGALGFGGMAMSMKKAPKFKGKGKAGIAGAIIMGIADMAAKMQTSKQVIKTAGKSEMGPMLGIGTIAAGATALKTVDAGRIGGEPTAEASGPQEWFDEEGNPVDEAGQPIKDEEPVKEDTRKEVKLDVIPSITKEDIVWQEGDYMPYVKTDEGDKLLSEVSENYFPVEEPINKITYTIDGETEEITDPEQLRVASQIKAVADKVAPEWSDYLLRVARYEGILNEKARNYMSNDVDESGKHYHSNNPDDLADKGGVWSTDRGVFQINDAAFPGVPDDVTDNVVRATLFAIAMIDAGLQERWYANETAKKAKTKVE